MRSKWGNHSIFFVLFTLILFIFILLFSLVVLKIVDENNYNVYLNNMIMAIKDVAELYRMYNGDLEQMKNDLNIIGHSIYFDSNWKSSNNVTGNYMTIEDDRLVVHKNGEDLFMFELGCLED